MGFLMKTVGFWKLASHKEGIRPRRPWRITSKKLSIVFLESEESDDLPRLRDARHLIRDYRKATKDTVGTLDLMLHYVETGTEFTNTYGDINEPFYNSLESVLNDFCEGIFKSSDPEQSYGQFNKRLVALKKGSIRNWLGLRRYRSRDFR
jgi:hypothetical protein